MHRTEDMNLPSRFTAVYCVNSQEKLKYAIIKTSYRDNSLFLALQSRIRLTVQTTGPLQSENKFYSI
jgi:hypothetical protein